MPHLNRAILLVLVLALAFASAASAGQSTAPAFPAFEKWRSAVLAGDSAALAALYIKSPEPRILDFKSNPLSFDDEISLWSSWRAKGLSDLTGQIVQQTDPQPNFHLIVLQLTLTFNDATATKHLYMGMAQGWFQVGDQWLLGVVQRSAPARLPQPAINKDIYSADADPTKEIAEALRTAAASHKRLLVVFGGNWCFDCHVLDEAFHSLDIAPTLNKSFLVVHVDIGEMNKNLDIAKKYDVPLDKGVPAIAVLDSDGKLLFSQKRGEFEAARSMAPEDILDFLHKWQPAAR